MRRRGAPPTKEVPVEEPLDGRQLDFAESEELRSSAASPGLAKVSRPTRYPRCVPDHEPDEYNDGVSE